ncbi:MAG: hypothetical protein WBM41_05260 [Arenicellales bacterium]
MRNMFLVGLFFSMAAQSQTWTVIDDPDKLAEIFSNTTMEATLKDGVKATAKYDKNGTGQIKAWGETFRRNWTIQGNDQVCISSADKPEGKTICYRIQQDSDNPEMYRSENLVTGETLDFMVTAADTVTSIESTDKTSGGAAKPSAEEIAAKLANPNSPMASMTFKVQYRTFQGNLPNANDQDSTTILFQPAFPFVTETGASVFFRPALPILIDQPAFNATNQDFDTESGIGDLAFDLAYGRTTENGILWAAGIISSLPVATEETLGSDLYTLGPEFLIGKLTPKWVIGAFPSHQWDVGGSGKGDINLTSIQLFGTVIAGGGWTWGSSPSMTYDHNTSQWTIPINFNAGKTVIRANGRPWKLSAEINYYVDQPDAFGPEWMIGFNIAPVIENPMTKWFK